MTLPSFFSSSARYRLLLVLSCCFLLFCQPLQGADLRTDSIVGQLPIDTPFVAVSRLHSEQYEAIKSNPAVQKLIQLEVFQKQWKEGDKKKVRVKIQGDEALEIEVEADKTKVEVEVDVETNDFKEFLETLKETPHGEEIVAFLKDAATHEVFVYGDSSWVTMPQSFQFVMNTMQRFSGSNPDLTDDEKAAKLLDKLKTLPIQQYLNIQLPNIVFGCQVEDAQRAQKLFGQLKETIEKQLENSDDETVQAYRDSFQVQMVDGVEYLTVKIPGSWIPFYLIDRSEMTRNQEALLEFFLDGIRKRSFIMALGVRDHSVLLSLGGDIKHLNRPTGEKRLIDHPHMAKLLEMADQKVTSITYYSEGMAQIGWKKDGNLKGYENWAQEIRNQSEESEGIAKVISDQAAEDVVEFGRDLQKFQSKPGAHLGYSLMTADGLDRVSYNWSEHPERDGSQPLTILDHVGGHPLLVVAGRKAYRPEVYEFRSKWLTRTWWYINKGVLAFYPEGANERFIYAAIQDQIRPHLIEFDRITRELFVPAFSDGQAALVIDAVDLREEPNELIKEDFPTYPYLPQVGLIWGISDREKLVEACDGYRKALNQLLVKASVMSPDDEEPIVIPKPTAEEVEGGTLYHQDLKKMIAEGENEIPVLPVGVISDTLAAITSDKNFAMKVLESNKLDIDVPETRLDQAMSCFSYVDLERFWSLLKPRLLEDVEQKVEAGEMNEERAEFARAFWDVVTQLKSVTSTTVHEDDVWIQRSHIRFGEVGTEDVE